MWIGDYFIGGYWWLFYYKPLLDILGYIIIGYITNFMSHDGNNSHVNFLFHKFVWNKHRCHSSTCIVWTSMSCALFRHECCVSIYVVFTQKSCTRFSCLDNAWHLCVNNTNPWNNKLYCLFVLLNEVRTSNSMKCCHIINNRIKLLKE